MTTSLTLISAKSITCAKTSQRQVGHFRDLSATYFPFKFNTLPKKKELAWKPPYYVWGGHPTGVALPPVRKGQARAPPSCLSRHSTSCCSAQPHLKETPNG